MLRAAYQRGVAAGAAALGRRDGLGQAPHRSGVYLNYLDHDDHHRIADAFDPAAHARLLELRHRYDPDRLLEPAAAVQGSEL